MSFSLDSRPIVAKLLLALAVTLGIIVLFYPTIFTFALIRRHWTTLGVLSSERESLNRISVRLDLMDRFQEEDRFLSDDSREHLKEFRRTRTRCLILVDALENQCRSRWFLFWRSAKFREDLADAREDIRRFWADVNVVEEEVMRWIDETS